MQALLLLLIPAFAILNHFRGGGALLGISSFVDSLPGRPIFYAAPTAGLLVWPAFGWLDALIFAAIYLVWGIPEWGRWFTLNRRDRFASSGDASWYGKIIEWLGDKVTPAWLGGITDPGTGLPRNDYACFTIRNTVLLAPFLFTDHPTLALLGPLQTFAYAIGWKLRPSGGIPPSELTFGTFIGTGVALVGLFS